MREHKGMYIVSIALLILATYLFTLFNNGAGQIEKQINEYKISSNLEDVNFSTLKEIPNIKELENQYNVVIEKLQWIDIRYDDKLNLRINREREKINLHQVKEGEGLDTIGNIVVNEEFYKNNNLNFTEDINIGDKKFKLNGYSASPDYLYFLENEASLFGNKETFAIAFISSKDFDSLNIENIKSKYVIKYNENSNKDIKNYIKDNYGLSSWVEVKDNAKVTTINGDLQGMMALGKYAPIVVMVIISILTGIIISRLVKSELSEIGTLYALGYKKSILLKHYMIYPITIVTVGAFISQILAILSKDALIGILSVEYGLPRLIINVNPIITSISVVLPMILILPYNLYTINKILKNNAVDLIKGNLDKKDKKTLDRKLKLKNMSFSTKFKIKELIRNYSRTLLTLISVIFSFMLIFFIFAMSDGMGRIINNYVDSYSFDNLYILNGISTERTEGEEFFAVPVTIKNGDKEEVISIEGRKSDGKLLILRDIKGEVITMDNNIIQYDLANSLGVKEGDTVTVKSDINDITLDIKIDKIADSDLGKKIYIPLDTLYNETELPKGSYNGIVSKQDLKIDNNKIMSKTTKSDIVDGVESMIKPLTEMMYIIGVIAAIIALSLLYVITSMIINENRNNISMLKIMGYSNKRINKTILNINDLIFLFGFILSVPISNYLNAKLFTMVTKELEFSINSKLSITSIIISFTIMTGMYYLSKFASKNKILSIPMEEALKIGRE